MILYHKFFMLSIHVGTFSKILFPALRLGYMILPNKLIKDFSYIKYVNDLHSPVLEQLTLARFIGEGHLQKHVRASKKHYALKCNLAIKTLTNTFGEKVKIFGQSAGIHFMVQILDVNFDLSLIDKMRKAGLLLPMVEKHTINKGFNKDKFLLGFGNLTDEEIISGIKIIESVLLKEHLF